MRIKALVVSLFVLLLVPLVVFAEDKPTEEVGTGGVSVSAECDKDGYVSVEVSCSGLGSVGGAWARFSCPSGVCPSVSLVRSSGAVSGGSCSFGAQIRPIPAFMGFVGYLGGYVVFFACLGVFGACVLVAVLGRFGGRGLAWAVVCGAVLVVLVGTSVRPREYGGTEYIKKIPVETEYGTVYCEVHYYVDEVSTDICEGTELVPYETVYEYNDDKPVTDEPVVKVEGVSGRSQVSTVTTYVNGKITDVSETTTVVEEPVSEVIEVGTKTTVVIQDIEEIVYVPNPDMLVGETKPIDSESTIEKNKGTKEITYVWDKETKKVTSSEEITKKPKVSRYYAGTILVESQSIPAKSEYVPLEDSEVGYVEVEKESVDGVSSTYYSVDISTTTGKMLPSSPRRFIKSEYTEPINGKYNIGVLSIEDESTPCEVQIEYLDSMWDNYVNVIQEGSDRVERVRRIMEIDEATGTVSDKVKSEISRELIQQESVRIEQRGVKTPNWVQRNIVTDQVQFKTVYQPEASLKGNETLTIQEGMYGRVYTVEMVACDENGVLLEGYDHKVVRQDVLTEPRDRIVGVAPNSPLLN